MYALCKIFVWISSETSDFLSGRQPFFQGWLSLLLTNHAFFIQIYLVTPSGHELKQFEWLTYLTLTYFISDGKSELVVRFFRCCLHVVWFPPLLKRGEIAQSYTKSEQKQTKVSKQENSLRHS